MRSNSVRLAAIAATLLLALAAGASSASAAFIHPVATASFGTDGTSGTTFNGLNRIALRQSNKHLYVLDTGGNKIYGFDLSTPGSYTPLGGSFPIAVEGGGGDPDIAVDDSSGGNGNIYYLSESNGLFAYTSAGGTAFTEPHSNFGDPCGVAVDAAGNSWVADYSGQIIFKFPPGGGGTTGNFSVSSQGSPCHIGADEVTGDIYVSNWNGPVYRYTAASNYKEKNLVDSGSAKAITVDPITHDVYVVHESGITSHRPDGSVIEEFGSGLGSLIGAAVDGSTGTVYVGVASSNQIKVVPGVTVPDLSIGEPTGFATVHGHLDPAGGGEVTSCAFEVSLSEFFPAGPNTHTVPCEPAAPYSTPQDVSADLTSVVVGESTYYYRLKAGNANGSNVTAASSFTPHWVAGLKTEAADNLDRKSATLHGSFLGTGEETHVYFKWGTSNSYGSTTPVQDIPANTTTNDIEATLSNTLQPGTIYHYEIVASNGKGTSESNDVTFETKPAVFGLTADAPTNVKTSTAELHGSFEGDGLATKYFYEYGSSTQYGNSTPVEEVPNPSGHVELNAAPIDELQPLHTYHFRVVAENSFGTTRSADRSFTTFTAPVVVTLTSSGVNATEADLHAVVAPHGAEYEYRFEYGPTSAYGSSIPVPDGAKPGTETTEALSEHLTGLDGGVYHFRLVVKNEFGESASKDQTFNFYPPTCPNSTVRQQTGASSLPDCRAYELVTPEDQGITIIYPATVPFSASATAPSRLGFVGAFGLIPNSGLTANNQGDMYIATRTSTGWKTKYVGIPSSEAAFQGGPPWRIPHYEPDKFQENTLSNPSLSTFVQWDNGFFSIGELYEEEHPKNSNAPFIYNTTTGKQIDRWPTNVGSIPGGVGFRGRTNASADLSHFVFTSDIPFAVGGEPGDMYDNDTVHDTVKIINVKENGDKIAGTFPLALSEDGSHILMVVREGGPYAASGPGELYLRVNDEHTYEMAPGHSVNYLGMTPDGKRIYFTTNAALLPEDTDTSRDLYMWEEDGSPSGRLVEVSKGNEPKVSGNTDACSASWTSQCDIEPISFTRYTAAQGGAGGSPFSDNFIAPENGDIYFLSPEQLHGNNGINGAENLYEYRTSTDKVQFVAALEPGGVACTKDQGEFFCSENDVARMETTPNNEFMAFLTGSKVTGYENAGHSEMYLWKPSSEEITCVSCRPSGEAPTSDVTTSHNGRYITNDGRTFFETRDALVPQDTNEAGDVYEYVDGRPQLITSGTNPGVSASGLATIMALPGLVGVSNDGTDVYFATYDVLVGQDRNGEAIKIYDARSGGGFQFTPPVPPCVAADECHGPSTEPPAAAPNGTGAELGGTGNVAGSGSKAKTNKKARHKRHKRHKKAHHKRKAQR